MSSIYGRETMELAQIEDEIRRCASEDWWPEEIKVEVGLLAVWETQVGVMMTLDLVEGVHVVDWIGLAARVGRLAQLCEQCGQVGWSWRLRRVYRHAVQQHGELVGVLWGMQQRARDRASQEEGE
jgi:hypothetical protein